MRQHNEDAFLDRCEAQLWVVADGMGGHHAGDVASRAIVDALARTPAADQLAAMCEAVDDELMAVHASLWRSGGQERRSIMGSTVVFLLLREGFALCGWAGDSRAYLYRGGGLRQMTRDHSLVAEMVAAGELDAADAESHPNANVVTRAIGASPHLALDYQVQELRPGDRWLLCSDGISKELNDTQLAALLATDRPADASLDGLFKACLAGPAQDNATAVLVDIGAGPA